MRYFDFHTLRPEYYTCHSMFVLDQFHRVHIEEVCSVEKILGLCVAEISPWTVPSSVVSGFSTKNEVKIRFNEISIIIDVKLEEQMTAKLSSTFTSTRNCMFKWKKYIYILNCRVIPVGCFDIWDSLQSHAVVICFEYISNYTNIGSIVSWSPSTVLYLSNTVLG